MGKRQGGLRVLRIGPEVYLLARYLNRDELNPKYGQGCTILAVCRNSLILQCMSQPICADSNWLVARAGEPRKTRKLTMTARKDGHFTVMESTIHYPGSCHPSGNRCHHSCSEISPTKKRWPGVSVPPAPSQ